MRGLYYLIARLAIGVATELYDYQFGRITVPELLKVNEFMVWYEDNFKDAQDRNSLTVAQSLTIPYLNLYFMDNSKNFMTFKEVKSLLDENVIKYLRFVLEGDELPIVCAIPLMDYFVKTSKMALANLNSLNSVKVYSSYSTRVSFKHQLADNN